ncbi:MAG: aminotransferase class III-fold pyridoxal phosphate-dependent enzyme, partial [Umezawaea sp.]
FAFQQAGIVPDVFTLAKGLGGGLPLGACIAVGDTAALLEPGQHGTTFGGNPISCAAALAVLDTIVSDGLLEHVSSVGKEIATGIEELNHPLVSGVRGAGLLLGITLREAVSAKAAAAAQRAGYLINAVQPDVIRLAPPLVLDEVDAHRLIADFPTFLEL